jgi:copper(I)-binding protein
MTITNRGTSTDRLMSADAEVSERVELHTHLMDQGVMRMRQVDSIELKPGEVTELKPGGLHVMFIGLKAPFKAGQQVPVTLRFERGGSLDIEVPVKTMDESGAMMQEHSAAEAQ